MKIEVLYPSVANLYGESVEIKFIESCIPGAEIIRTNINDIPEFTKDSVDMIYMGPMSENSQEIVLSKLRPYKEKIEELIDNGTTFLVIGNALEIFGKSIENEDSSVIECLGIFGTVAKRRMMQRYNSLFLGEYEGMDIVGFKAQFSHSYGENPYPLFKCIKGSGLNEQSQYEGIRKNNFFATYLLGPLLIMNPEFAKYFFKTAGIEKAVIPHEEELMTAYRKRLGEFKQPDIKLD